MKQYTNLKIIKNKKSVCIIGHIDPDPDAIASMIVLKNFLMKHFKISQVDLFAEHKILNNNLYQLLENETLNPTVKNYDVAIMIDCPNSLRLGKFKQIYDSANIKINIDHHATNDNNSDINIIEICSSTCEIIYSILKEYNYKLSPNEQGKLYAGIICDTNNFSVGELSSRTFDTVGSFIENINHTVIHNLFLNNNSLNNLKATSMAIENLKTFEKNKILITHISHIQAKKLKLSKIDMFGIVNRLLTVDSAKLVCFIQPGENKQYYVSMRSKPGYNVSNIATKHNGGGHICAAAFVSSEKLEDIYKNIFTEFKDELSGKKDLEQKIF